MNVKIQKKSGLVLIETMLAIAVLAVGVIIAGQYLNMSIESQVLSREYLIANNLADEGLELVKALRNTNWIQHPASPDLWLELTPFDDSSESDIPPISGHSYVIYNTIKDQTIQLVDVVDTNNNNINLSLSTESVENNNKFKLHSCLYSYSFSNNSKDVSNGCNFNDSSYTTDDYTKFYRSIRFINVDDTKADLEIKVQWHSIDGTRTIERTTTIYNK